MKKRDRCVETRLPIRQANAAWILTNETCRQGRQSATPTRARMSGDNSKQVLEIGNRQYLVYFIMATKQGDVGVVTTGMFT